MHRQDSRRKVYRFVMNTLYAAVRVEAALVCPDNTAVDGCIALGILDRAGLAFAGIHQCELVAAVVHADQSLVTGIGNGMTVQVEADSCVLCDGGSLTIMSSTR